MALPALATIDDVAVLLGGQVDDLDQAEALLRRASALVRAEAGCRWVDDDGELIDPLPDGIVEVVAGMVERVLRNPDGTVQEQAGAFMRSFGQDAATRVYLTASDRSIIAAASCSIGGGSNGLWTLGTTRGPLETPSVTDPFREMDF